MDSVIEKHAAHHQNQRLLLHLEGFSGNAFGRSWTSQRSVFPNFLSCVASAYYSSWTVVGCNISASLGLGRLSLDKLDLLILYIENQHIL